MPILLRLLPWAAAILGGYSAGTQAGYKDGIETGARLDGNEHTQKPALQWHEVPADFAGKLFGAGGQAATVSLGTVVFWLVVAWFLWRQFGRRGRR